MPMYYFHLRDTDTVVDTEGTELANETAARDHAANVARELTFKSAGMMQRQWSDWTLSVHDDKGTELFSFALSDVETGGK